MNVAIATKIKGQIIQFVVAVTFDRCNKIHLLPSHARFLLPFISTLFRRRQGEAALRDVARRAGCFPF